jgi:hypothetical protein
LNSSYFKIALSGAESISVVGGNRDAANRVSAVLYECDCPDARSFRSVIPLTG